MATDTVTRAMPTSNVLPLVARKTVARRQHLVANRQEELYVSLARRLRCLGGPRAYYNYLNARIL